MYTYIFFKRKLVNSCSISSSTAESTVSGVNGQNENSCNHHTQMNDRIILKLWKNIYGWFVVTGREECDATRCDMWLCANCLLSSCHRWYTLRYDWLLKSTAYKMTFLILIRTTDLFCDVMSGDFIWFDMMWCDMIWCPMVWSNVIWCDV